MGILLKKEDAFYLNLGVKFKGPYFISFQMAPKPLVESVCVERQVEQVGRVSQ